jgi:hypothetical protein
VSYTHSSFLPRPPTGILEWGIGKLTWCFIRANTLKTLLESYLSQPPTPIPNLQDEANKLAKEAIEEATHETKGVQATASSSTNGASSATDNHDTQSLPDRTVN